MEIGAGPVAIGPASPDCVAAGAEEGNGAAERDGRDNVTGGDRTAMPAPNDGERVLAWHAPSGFKSHANNGNGNGKRVSGSRAAPHRPKAITPRMTRQH